MPGVEGLWRAAGHYRSGLPLSPVTGELLADGIEGKGIPADARVFDPARLLGRGEEAQDLSPGATSCHPHRACWCSMPHPLALYAMIQPLRGGM